MANTEDQISANLIALNFDNPATLALFEKVSQALGIPIDNTLTEFGNNQNTLTAIVSDKNFGKDQYYTDAAKAFQLGDDLIIDPTTGKNIYAVIDPSKQIITQAAFEELINGNDVQLFLKIAKKDPVSGLLVPLDGTEFPQFAAYFGTIEIPGLPVSLINKAANILNFTTQATFFKTYNLNTLQNNVSLQLNAFRDTFAFDGEFFNGDLQDFIKKNVPGMRDFFITGTTLDSKIFNGSTLLGSGYFNYISTILAQITYTGV